MIDPDRFRAFCERELVNERGEPVRVLPWWIGVAEGLRDKLEVAVKTIRQQGKSLLAGAVSNYLLFNARDSYLLLVAASEAQAKAIAAQKFKRPIEANPRLAHGARVLENRIEVPALGNVLEIVPASEATSPGRTVNLLVLDEAREIDDSLYLRLRPSTLACEGRTLITSTPGPPRGFFYEIVSNPGPETFVFDAGADVINPYTSERHLREAAGLAHLFPGLHAREYLGRFADLGDEYVTRERLDACVDPALENRATAYGPVFAFLDLSRRRDLTSLVAVLRDGDDLITVVRIETIDPRQCQGGEMDFGAVRLLLAELFSSFQVRVLGVDDRAEAGELLAWCGRQRWGGAVRPMAATAQSNMEQWGRLAERIGAGTIRLPAHKRLLAELLSLRVEDMAGGRAWRVVDTRRRFHRDVSMALAGATWLATEKPAEGDGMKVGVLSEDDERDADKDSVTGFLNERF